MSSKQLVALAVRLFAVVIVVWVMRHGFVMLPLLAGGEASLADALTVFLSVSIPLVVAVLLWVFPLRVAGHLLPRHAHAAHHGPWSLAEVQAVAFSILGLWVLTRAVSDLFYWMTYLHLLRGTGSYRTIDLMPADVGGLVGTGVELAIGIYLLFGARGLAGLIGRISHGPEKG